MTNEQKAQMLEMRMAGYSLQYIADHFGCSRQWVSQNLPTIRNGYRAKKKLYTKVLESIVYPNIKQWMIKNNCSMNL